MSDKIFCKNGGCTAKLGAGALEKVLSLLPKKSDQNLLVGFDHKDDAAVYQLSEEIAMVQTLDFFPAMVENPYIFGQIAAANALSDIYAMGGEVKTALNIVCFPETLDLNILGQILLGGSEKVIEAGGVLCGGHSIVDEEIKYGLSVSGIVHPKKIYSNQGSKAGDILLLTKPLGVGIVLCASRINEASEEAMQQAIESMTTLNKKSAELMKKYEVHALTDVTGFGLLGHLSEMLNDEISAEIYAKQIPYIPEAYDYAKEFYISAAAQKNRNFLGNQVKFMIDDFAMEEILFDPQTSGGLLMSVKKEDAQALIDEIKSLGLACGIIGQIIDKVDEKIIVK